MRLQLRGWLRRCWPYEPNPIHQRAVGGEILNELTHIDLFSGIGGFALAARWAGFKTICFSEVDDYASAVLRKHWPDVPNVGDITRADFGPYSGATLLTGGFPCQPFSVAGKRAGAGDDRFLWPAMLAVVERTKPAWIVGENVTGIIRMELDRVLADLEAEGYTAWPLVIPACAVDARHRRDRVWIMAHNQSLGRGEVRGRASGQSGHTDKRGEAATNAMRERSFPASLQGVYPSQKGSGARDEQSQRSCRWPAEPGVGRVAHGIPSRVDRIKGLGNAIVPQVAFEILRQIAAIETT